MTGPHALKTPYCASEVGFKHPCTPKLKFNYLFVGNDKHTALKTQTTTKSPACTNDCSHLPRLVVAHVGGDRQAENFMLQALGDR